MDAVAEARVDASDKEIESEESDWSEAEFGNVEDGDWELTRGGE